MRVGPLLPIMAVVAAACGGGQAPGVSEPTTTAPSPTTFSSTPTAGPSSVATTPPSETTEVELPPDGTVTLGAPDPGLLAASPPGEIDWTTVGAGWLLVDHPIGHGGPYAEPTTLDERGLYLVAPDDVVYGVSALPSDGSRIVAVSADGRQVLVEPHDAVCDDGCECPTESALTMQQYGAVLVDLRSTTWRPVLDPVTVPVCIPGVFQREVAFTADSDGIWVSETWFTDVQHHALRVHLSRVDLATGAWTTIVDEDVGVDETAAPSSWWISAVELADGRIVTSTPGGTWLREPDGTPIRELDDPGTSCELGGAWDADQVLARCVVPPAEFPAPPEVDAADCRTTGLWLITLDGSPAQPLAIPLDDRGSLSCWAGYASAEQIGEELAVQVGGDGCTDGVDLVAADGHVTHRQPEITDACQETLLGVRNDAWLIASVPASGDEAVYQVTRTASTRVDLPSGEVIVL